MKVPNEKLREAFLASGLTVCEVAVRCGWKRTGGSCDQTRVARLLGLRAESTTYKNGKRYGPYPRTMLRECDAKVLAEAIGVFPVEVGF